MVDSEVSTGDEKPNEVTDSDSFRQKISNAVDISKQNVKAAGRAARHKISTFDAKEFGKTILDTPDVIKKEYRRHGASGLLTKFPALMILIFASITLFFMVPNSGFMDINEDSPKPWQIREGSSLEVNGSLDVYLPQGDPVADAIKEVQKDWSTNVMILYVETDYGSLNITAKPILEQISELEGRLNPRLSDPSDNVIYILSLSTVIKETNSSPPRVLEAFINEVGSYGQDLGEDLANQLNEQLDDYSNVLGRYEIPDQLRIDQIVGEMYDNDGDATPGLDKLARDTDGDGILDRAVIIVAVSESVPADKIIKETELELEEISEDNNWNCDKSVSEPQDPEYCDGDELGMKVTLTGPVPITNAVTEFSFKLFWQIFPIACILVALGLFVFHSDLLQTGNVKVLQGLKVIIIAGLPTLCSVFWTLGIIGYMDYEVTMTVIIVGPILLALGVSYGLHITNRYAEEEGDPQEKMAKALSSTGKAVFLSAITTVIGFISLTFTPMAPIKTVGFALSGGIVIVYILTMAMVPNLTILLDLKKPKHPPLPIFDAAVAIPLKWNQAVIAIFITLIILSATWGMSNVDENIDLLGMAPEDELAVQKMKQYSSEFNAGQIGMLLVHGNVTGETCLPANCDNDANNDDPFEKLKGIDELERKLNLVEHTTAVSIVFLMKSVGVAVNVSGTPIWEVINGTPLPEQIKEIGEIIFNRQSDEDATFWNVLMTLESADNVFGQIFLLNVFYASLTDETRELFVSKDYKRSLIYVDMPFLPVKETADSVAQIDEYAKQPYPGDVYSGRLTGVAAVAIAVNELIVASQWSSLAFAVILTLLTLGVVFRDLRFAIWTTLPVVATVALQWLVMAQMNVSLSLVTVMIGSILVGVGVDFSIHIANRIRELGGGMEAIRISTVSTGMSLFEAATVTTLGLVTAYMIPIPEIKPFITVIIILLWIAAASALILLPAIFVTLEKWGIGTSGGSSTMKRKLGLGASDAGEVLLMDSVFIHAEDDSEAW